MAEQNRFPLFRGPMEIRFGLTGLLYDLDSITRFRRGRQRRWLEAQIETLAFETQISPRASGHIDSIIFVPSRISRYATLIVRKQHIMETTCTAGNTSVWHMHVMD